MSTKNFRSFPKVIVVECDPFVLQNLRNIRNNNEYITLFKRIQRTNCTDSLICFDSDDMFPECMNEHSREKKHSLFDLYFNEFVAFFISNT